MFIEGLDSHEVGVATREGRGGGKENMRLITQQIPNDPQKTFWGRVWRY